jgi:hypothetical protein
VGFSNEFDVMADWDSDGIVDPNEGFPPAAGQSNRYLWDSDGDGLCDSDEDTNCDGDQDTSETCTRDRDSDDDGLSDGLEVLVLLTDPLDPNDPPSYSDSDGDGVPASIDPDDGSPDSDGDGYRDSYELEQGTDPDNASDKPTLGDVNDDTNVNNIDAFIALNLFLGNISWESFNCDNMDVNRDGLLNNIDAFIILNYFLGNIAYLPL